MGTETKAPTVREAVGVFHDAKSFQAAVDELMSSGFDRSELSLVAGQSAVEEKLGHMYEKVEDLEDDPGVPSRAFAGVEAVGDAQGALIASLTYLGAVAATGAVVASGGALATVIGAAVASGGIGAAIGTVLARIVGHNHAEYLQQQLDRGGILLWVRTRNPEREARATAILRKHSAHDVHVHGLRG